MAEDAARGKALNLFKYLREIARLRSRPVTTLDSYEAVVWLHEVSQGLGCESPLWGRDVKPEIESWFEISKPNLTPPPSLPELLHGLIPLDQLGQFGQIPEISHEAFGTQPELQRMWELYLEQQWLSWAAEREGLEPRRRVYGRLHSILQRLLRESEIFEFVLGVGLLTWETPGGLRVKRHLLAIPLSIDLEEATGKITIGSSSEDGEVRVEQDMLDPLDRPDGTVQARIEERVREYGELAVLPANASALLQTWIHNVSSQGGFSDSLDPPEQISLIPRIHLAPAFILRRRMLHGLAQTYTEIIHQLEQGAPVPFTVKKLVEITEDVGDPVIDQDTRHDSGATEEALLPLPSNDEQRQIVRALNERRGLLVKGPPGTGKSHTIANLICYLLATGNRILVTSQTPRALKVLKALLPEEIKPLSVSLLGGDQESLRDLEFSVQEITSRQSRWSRDDEQRQVRSLTERLGRLMANEADLTRRMRELREVETYHHQIAAGRYTGTAQQIAERIASERPECSWLSERVSPEGDPPLGDAEALELLQLLRRYPDERCREVTRPLPKLESLPSEQDFVLMVDRERESHNRFQRLETAVSSNSLAGLRNQSREDVEQLRLELLAMRDHSVQLTKLTEIWAKRAARDVVDLNDKAWAGLLAYSRTKLDGLGAAAAESESSNLQLPEDADGHSALSALRSLHEHLACGGGFGFPLLRPTPVKQARKLLRRARLDGQKLRTLEDVGRAVTRLDAELSVEDLWGAWSAHASRVAGSLPVQSHVLAALCDKLEQILSVKSQLLRTRSILSKLESVREPDWRDPSQIDRLVQVADAYVAYADLETSRATLSHIEQTVRGRLANPSTHPAAEKLLTAVERRDERAYGAALSLIRSVLEDRQRVARKGDLDSKLRPVLPSLSDLLRANSVDPVWEQRLSTFEMAYRWAQARTWFEDFCRSSHAPDLQTKLSGLQSDISATKTKLVASRAWLHCLEKLREHERVHLVAWTQAIKRGGKWTGKRAPIHRAAARQHMEECRGAVPAWIMPLYRVAEAVKPGTDLFDVVIVDEASQSGPDALFLAFLCKKMLIVGDDEQISPDEVGVEREQVDVLRTQYLKDIPVADAFGVESSLFALGSIFFGGRISLSEHFRCMPEIIQFSNKLCYSDSPLEPLRRYTGSRLEPVKVVHVQDGYQEGKSSNAFNPPEAQRLVHTLKRCCELPEYAGKSMGVISLLGDRQAFEIERMLLDEIGAEQMAARRIICGDAYSFQGDERDVIFLSMVAAPSETAMRAVTAAPIRKRFNVAASRARDQMWLFHTPTVNDFRNKECLRYQLLEYCQNPKLPPRGGGRQDCTNKFERDVFDRIAGRGYRVIPQYAAAGYFIDMVVEGERASLAVECDGDAWHTAPEDQEKDMRRERILRRCGWRFWRLRGSEFYYNPDAALESLWEELAAHGIAPGGRDIPKNDASRDRRPAESSSATGMPATRQGPVLKPLEFSDGHTAFRAFTAGTREPTGEQGRDHERHARDVKHEELKRAIVEVLRGCPNHTCTRKSLTSRVCAHLGMITRGNPRMALDRRLSKALRDLVDKRVVELYKSVNLRIRLLHTGDQTSLLSD